MTMEQKLRAAIEEKIEPEALEVVNQSHLHKGHAGDDGSGESHFKLRIVWKGFGAYNRVQRQRLIFDILGKNLINNIHALQLSCITPQEITEKEI